MVPRNIFGTRKKPSRIKLLAACLVVCGVLGGAALLRWRVSDSSDPIASASASLADASATPSGTAEAPAPSAPTPPPIAAQQASVASIIEVVVGRNDTLDAIFRRMSLNKSDLAAIRNLPGIRQSLDSLRPGDSLKLTHTDGDIKGLTRKVSETQTLEVIRQDGGFEAKMIDNPVEVRVRTARATIDSSLFQAAGAADISDIVALKLANVFGWDIDFVLDIRVADPFTPIYPHIFP